MFFSHLGHGEDFEIHCLDKFTYAANEKNIDLEVRKSGKLLIHRFDINSSQAVDLIERNIFEFCINFAAESHVDRSISGPYIFGESNVMGTLNLLEAWRKYQKKRFIQIGTDEVYGSIEEGFASENHILNPSSPYSASKASADLIALSYATTFSMDVIVTRCSNNYGPHQHPEKLVPKMIENIFSGKPLGIYGDGSNIREWIHVDDHVSALIRLAEQETLKHRVYNIGTNFELTNLELIKLISSLIGDQESEVEFIADRLGHDRRYALNSSRINEELQWKPQITFLVGLAGLIKSMKK
jgi:dTDP-glucose 4,6-dehydratase